MSALGDKQDKEDEQICKATQSYWIRMRCVFKVACWFPPSEWKLCFQAEILTELLYMEIKAAQYHFWCPLCSISIVLPLVQCKWYRSLTESLIWIQHNSLKHLPVYLELSGPSNDQTHVADPGSRLQKLILNLTCSIKTTSRCSRLLKMHELDSNRTSDDVARDKRLTPVTNCMLYLKHTPTET